jgi:hypothetical protein
MPLVTVYHSASGQAYDNCCFLGQRFDADRGYHPGDSECWVLRTRPAPDGDVTVGYQYGTQRWFTGLWRSLRGVVYVSDATGEMHVNPDLAADDSEKHWARHKLKASLDGVWGLDDSNVFAWGGTFDDRFSVFRWDGRSWSEMPSPGFDVRALHGLSPTLLCAVGKKGGIALWDGSQWTRMSAPLADDLVSVFVAGTDEYYATSGGGTLLEGSKHGWGKVADGPGPGTPLYAVAKWHGELWIAAGTFGLLRRKGTSAELEVVKSNIQANGFDARQALVISCFDEVAGSADGSDFEAAGADSLAEARSARALLDFS